MALSYEVSNQKPKQRGRAMYYEECESLRINTSLLANSVLKSMKNAMDDDEIADAVRMSEIYRQLLRAAIELKIAAGIAS